MKQAALKQPASQSSGPAKKPAEPFFKPLPKQAKLNVSTRGDMHEREADHAADAVVHGRGPMAQGAQISQQVTPRVQRQDEDAQTSPETREADPNWREHEPASCDRPGPAENEPLQMQEEDTLQRHPEEEEELQTKHEDQDVQTREEETTPAPQEETAQLQAEDVQARAMETDDIQRREAGPAVSARAARMQVVERQLRASRGRGNPLPEGVRRKMEQGLGADFSGVRIHTDHPAFLMTRLLNAKAFASGRDIYFSPNRFAPGTMDGDHLIAHELAHTLQQAAVPVRRDAVVQKADDENAQTVRPESLKAIQIAYSYAGRINSNLVGPDGNRVGWDLLKDVFHAAFDRDPFPDPLLKRPMAHPYDLPHWCGIFAWHALRKAGFDLPPWKLSTRMLDNTELRPPGQLPQVGDIAYRDKLPWMPEGTQLTHHQALVARVESHETAKNKTFKQIEVTTIDGNTAGTNNMGGQVQEITQPIGNWRYFFDPGGKISMPPAQMVVIDRSAPEPAASEEKTAAAPENQDSSEPTDVTALEQEVVPHAEAQPGADAQINVDLDLPPPVQPDLEPAAKVEQVELAGTSDMAAAGFTKAAPSAMALTAPDLGQALTKKTASEKQDIAAEAPDLKAQTGGDLDASLTPPAEIAVPEDVTLQDEGQGKEVGDLAPEPYNLKSKTPSVAQSPVGQEMKNQPSGGFFDWLKQAFKRLVASIPTRDSISTNAGPKQRVALSGEADVTRMDRQRSQGTERLRTERDAKVAAFKSHPGQSNIRPRKVERSFKPEFSPEPAEPVAPLSTTGEVDDYAQAEWPADFRSAADQKMAKKLEGGMAKAHADVETAGRTRDAEKGAAIAEAERKTAAANTAADDKQRQAVLAGRGDVARQQGQAVQDAYDNVASFSSSAAKQQTDNNKAIATDVKTTETTANDHLKTAQTDAEDLKSKTEKEAETEKTNLAKKEKDSSWWKLDVKSLVNKVVTHVDNLFTNMRRLVKEGIEAARTWAVDKINRARNRAISALNGFRDWAKDAVNTYVKDKYPGLARALNAGIDTVVNVAITGVNAAADGAVAAVNALAKRLAAALDGLLARFQAALKLAVGMIGAVLTGDFVGALKLAFEAACALAGVDPKPILDFLARAGHKLISILKRPGPFIQNLLSAVGMGIRSFASNFLQHFKSGVISWLTGALSAVPITLPSKWDLKGFFSLVAQILGLTYANIKARIIKKFPKAQGVFDKIEKGWGFIKMLLNRDYAGLWQEVKTRLQTLKETILGAIQKWTLLNVIKQGVMWLLSMLNPASAIVRLIKMLADLVFWLVENFQRIKAFVLSVYGAVTNIAAGILKPAAKAVEDALARALPVVISFIASAIGLGDIAGAIQGVLKKVQAPVNKAIDTLIDKVVAFARKIVAKVVGGAKKVKDAAMSILRWWTEKRRFRSKDGGDHKIYYKGEGKRADLWLASDPTRFEVFLSEQMQSDDKDQAKKARAANKIYQDEVLASEAKMERLREERKQIGTQDKTAYRNKQGELQTEIRNFRSTLAKLSAAVSKMNIQDTSTAITEVTKVQSGHKQVTALPLTFLPGKTKGSSPTQDPTGYDYARKINDAEGKTVWIRGHMLNDNVHGPGESWNLVPIPQSTNRLMESRAESDLKSRVHTKKEQLYFRATANFWAPTNSENAGFPKKIILVWHKAEKKNETWKKADHIKTETFDSPEPPAQVDASIPGLISGSTTKLLSAINSQTAGTAVTTYFIGLLKENGSYGTTADIRTKLTSAQSNYQDLNEGYKENRSGQIDRTIAAVNANKVGLS